MLGKRGPLPVTAQKVQSRNKCRRRGSAGEGALLHAECARPCTGMRTCTHTYTHTHTHIFLLSKLLSRKEITKQKNDPQRKSLGTKYFY